MAITEQVGGALAAPTEACAAPAVTLPVIAGRELRLDLFRGLALWLIFIDHLPANLLTWLTIRNYGFSDATEIFIFISGYTAAFVYGRTMLNSGPVIATARILRRAWQIYVAHVFLFTIFLAEISYVATSFKNPLYAEEMGIMDFLKQPDATIIQALLLRFRPVNMDVLPLYIVLMVALPLILWLMKWKPDLTLGLGVLLYALTWWFDLALSAYPEGTWVFNPMAWQLLFVFGAWCALGGAQRLSRLVAARATLWFAVAYLLAAFYVTLTWYVPQMEQWIPPQLAHWMYPIDKTNLDVLRIVHFLALAVLMVRFLPQDWPGLKSPWLRPVIVCGQHSLEIFCLGIFLAFVGQFILTEVSSGAMMHGLMIACGIVIMWGLAATLSWYRHVTDKKVVKTVVGATGAGLAVLLLWSVVPSIACADEAVPARCQVAPYLLETKSRLIGVGKRISGHEALEILVVGSGSTRIPSSEESSYPARMQAVLREQLPGVPVNVAVEILGKKTAEEAASTFARLMNEKKPNLVIWQTGTADAIQSVDPEDFRNALGDGVSVWKNAGVEVVLINLQYSPRTELVLSVSSYLDNMRLVAQEQNVPLFDRFTMMREWNTRGRFDLSTSSPGPELAKQVHDCLGRALARFVMDAAMAAAAPPEK